MNKFEQIIDFTLCYNKHKTKVFNFTLKMVNDKDTAEDIVQDVFLKLYINFPVIKNKDSIIYWVFKTTRNLIYEYYREKQKLEKLISIEDEDGQTIEIDSKEDLLHNYELKELKQIVQMSLEHIPIEQKEIFLLKEYGELSYKEIALLLNIDEELVKGRLFKARQKLIKILAKKINE
ncbi:MAG: RNA polymerase sigma factor [bacterium]